MTDHAKRKRIKYWVLRTSSGVYFREMVAIGPRGTLDLDEAAQFTSRRNAELSEAYCHPMCAFTAEAIR